MKYTERNNRVKIRIDYNKITAFIVLMALIWSISVNAQITPDRVAAAVGKTRTYLNEIDSKNEFNGTLLIAEHDRILFQEAYGYEDENRETPNTIETSFDIASMGKMFTAVSILQLQEKGLLKLNNPIGEILPDYPNLDEREKITVKQLLSHTSGLGDFFSKEFFEQPEGTIQKLEDILPFFVNDPLEFLPGESFRYSNAGFVVLGLIIENITKQSYNSYVQQNIFKPLKINSSVKLFSSAGGGRFTITDLHKFALALKSNKLISGKSFNLMTTDGFENKYGLGLSLNTINGIEIYGHNGGAPGVSGEVDITKNTPIIIISLSNRSPMDGWAQVRTFIRNEFFGETKESIQLVNTEEVIKTYKEKGFDLAKVKMNELNNNISDKNTYHYAEQYLHQQKFDKAIEVMNLIVEAYSNEWYPYSYLADFYLESGQKEEAIFNYKKSLDMNPENQRAIDQLALIDNK
ncbi:MAG: serine hydrolase [Maribacter litoralis]|uniref:serine hydrolase n=1 Tax=Maribacter litoralis TaxID=2059726 RepID=UPI00329A378A